VGEELIAHSGLVESARQVCRGHRPNSFRLDDGRARVAAEEVEQ